MDIFSANPHKTTLIYQGESSDLKGLLHILIVTMIPTKVS